MNIFIAKISTKTAHYRQKLRKDYKKKEKLKLKIIDSILFTKENLVKFPTGKTLQTQDMMMVMKC